MLDPQARALLDLIVERGVPAVNTLSPAEARVAYRERRAFTQPDAPDVAQVESIEIEGLQGVIGLRTYRPRVGGAAMPALVYFHGGGWTIGDLDTHDVLCRQLCLAAGVMLVSVDYRLGPEHRFPAAIDDALAATRWVRREASALGIDAERIAVGGDSAGGNLAAVVPLLLRDAGEALPAFQLLISRPPTCATVRLRIAATAAAICSRPTASTTTAATTSPARRSAAIGAPRRCWPRTCAACRRHWCSPPVSTRCATKAGSTPMRFRPRAMPCSMFASSARSTASSRWGA